MNSIQSQFFDSYVAADAFAEAREAEGYEHVSVLTNTPRPGSWKVSWGSLQKDWTLTDLLHDYMKIFDEREQRALDDYETSCIGLGRCIAAEEAAARAGVAGRDAAVFVDGFCGMSAKWTNPRAEGREPIFRAGRKAAGSPEGQRAIRAATVRARSIVEFEPAPPFREGGLIANGEF